MKAIIFVFLCVLIFSSADEYHPKIQKNSKTILNEMESSSEFWKQKAQNYLTSKLNSKMNRKKAKNVIFFLGDGMSLTTVAATRMYMGKEENELSFEKFPHFGLSKTYCTNGQVADSACSSTAYLSGVKAQRKTIGVKPHVKIFQCVIDEMDKTESIASWSQKSGKATGIVTTTRITHASPAGVYAHIAFRDWENNNDIEQNCSSSSSRDIAHQLVHEQVGMNLKVILGGGRVNFINTTELDDEGRPGLRTDGRNLIDEWIVERNKKAKAKYVWHKQQLDEIDIDKTDYLLGLFESDHCMYNLDILNNNLQHQEPLLTDMTVTAIKMLQKEDNGFFLFVEGGRIDLAHHNNLAQKALEDTKEFARAIDVARKMTNEADTLIVVSSDHSHVFTYGGEPSRGDDILGFAGTSDIDHKPYLTLGYANGPGYEKTYNKTERINLSDKDIKDPNFSHSATVPLEDDTHAAEDVGVYASGPWSHLFVGNYEQNNLPLLMAYAAQIGPYCVDAKCNSGSFITSSIFFVVASIAVAMLNP